MDQIVSSKTLWQNLDRLGDPFQAVCLEIIKTAGWICCATRKWRRRCV